jgi:hypothetical protein
MITKNDLSNAQSQILEISSKPKKYYSVINNKTGRRDEYSYLAWNIAWFLAFFIGILTGILIK